MNGRRNMWQAESLMRQHLHGLEKVAGVWSAVFQRNLPSLWPILLQWQVRVIGQFTTLNEHSNLH